VFAVDCGEVHTTAAMIDVASHEIDSAGGANHHDFAILAILLNETLDRTQEMHAFFLAEVVVFAVNGRKGLVQCGIGIREDLLPCFGSFEDIRIEGDAFRNIKSQFRPKMFLDFEQFRRAVKAEDVFRVVHGHRDNALSVRYKVVDGVRQVFFLLNVVAVKIRERLV
jgi:hypothetical protein